MQITIEKNVPVPPIVRIGGSKRATYPFAQMEPGDSFALSLAGHKAADGKRDRMAARLSAAATSHAKRRGGEFTVRELKDEGVVRVWRVA